MLISASCSSKRCRVTLTTTKSLGVHEGDLQQALIRATVSILRAESEKVKYNRELLQFNLTLLTDYVLRVLLHTALRQFEKQVRSKKFNVSAKEKFKTRIKMIIIGIMAGADEPSKLLPVGFLQWCKFCEDQDNSAADDFERNELLGRIAIMKLSGACANSIQTVLFDGFHLLHAQCEAARLSLEEADRLQQQQDTLLNAKRAFVMARWKNQLLWACFDTWAQNVVELKEMR